MVELLKILYNEMSIEEMMQLNNEGYEFVINDGEVKGMVEK